MDPRIEKLLGNRIAMAVICVGTAVCAVGAIATGFAVIYGIVTYVGT